MRLPSEKPACPRRRMPSAVRTESGRRQTERGGKGCWDAEQPDRDLPRCGNACIASQPLGPREARVCALCARQDHVRDGWRSGGGWRQAHLKVLVAHELHAGTPMCSAAGVAPEERGRTKRERMQEHADLARLCRGVAFPLTLLAERTRAATANTGRIHHAQTSVSFPTPLLDSKRLPCRTPERSIGLERKVCAGETASFPRRVAVAGGAYPDAGAAVGGRVEACSFGGGRAGANSRRCAPGQDATDAPVPNGVFHDPLCHHLPALLPPGRMSSTNDRDRSPDPRRDPRGLKGATMQIELDDISRR